MLIKMRLCEQCERQFQYYYDVNEVEKEFFSFKFLPFPLNNYSCQFTSYRQLKTTELNQEG